MKHILVLGGSGMLGSMIVDVLSRNEEYMITATVRQPGWADRFRRGAGRVRWQTVDFSAGGVLPSIFTGQHWIINAVGITKPLIHDDNAVTIQRAINVNAKLPHAIGEAAGRSGARVLQIATDCVYSGTRGSYSERDPHDALDVYGKTKSLGETFHPSVHHLRCSIIGPEPKDFKFILEWFRGRPQGARVDGFVNHHWNGVTTLQFARLCGGVIDNDVPLGHLQHVVPEGTVSKAELLRTFGDVFARHDIIINDVDAKVVVDRTLTTGQVEANKRLWAAAGYSVPPTVGEMLRELAAYSYRPVTAGAA